MIGSVCLVFMVLVAHVRVEVVADARPEAVEIDIDEKPVAARLDAGERHPEQIGQRRPVEPLIAHRSTHERQPERQDGLDPVVERSWLCLGRRNQFLRFGLPPQMPESNLLARPVVGLADQGRDGGADLVASDRNRQLAAAAGPMVARASGATPRPGMLPGRGGLASW